MATTVPKFNEMNLKSDNANSLLHKLMLDPSKKYITVKHDFVFNANTRFTNLYWKIHLAMLSIGAA